MKINPKLALLIGLAVGSCAIAVLNRPGWQRYAIAAIPIPSVGVGYAIASSRKNRQIEAAQTEEKRARDEIDRLNRVRQWDGEEIIKLTQSLEEHRSGLDRAADTILIANKARQTLENELSTAKGENGALQAQLERARTEISEWEAEWQERLATETEKLYRDRRAAEIAKIEGECDSLMSEAMACVGEIDELLHLGKALNDDKTEASNRMSERFVAIADSLKKSSSEEISAYLETIELLNLKVARLQRENAGEILEPRYIEPAYDLNARIANDIARCLWEQSHCALAVVDFEESKSGEVAVGFGYSALAQSGDLLARLNREIDGVRSRLGLAYLSKLSKPGHINAFELRFRREPKANKEAIERLFVSFPSLAAKILTELDSKPTVRIMGATGEGKGIAARALLATILSEVSGWAVRLHDPQDGSDEDYWGIPKVSRGGREMRQSLKAIAKQLEGRESGSESNRVTALDILDEIDTQLEAGDKARFLDLISRIRHHRMRLMLIGQNPKVSRAGFQWSDMAQMIAIYMGASAIDAIENHPSLKRSKGALPEQFDLIREWVESENQLLPSARKYHWGLCYLPSHKEPMWFILPPAEDVVINPGNNTILSEFSLDNLLLANSDSQANSNESKSIGNKYRKSPGNATETPRQNQERGNAESTARNGFPEFLAMEMENAYVGGDGKNGNSEKATCKSHPVATLTQYKNGAYYCPECKRKLRKRDEVIFEL